MVDNVWFTKPDGTPEDDGYFWFSVSYFRPFADGDYDPIGGFRLALDFCGAVSDTGYNDITNAENPLPFAITYVQAPWLNEGNMSFTWDNVNPASAYSDTNIWGDINDTLLNYNDCLSAVITSVYHEGISGTFITTTGTEIGKLANFRAKYKGAAGIPKANMTSPEWDGYGLGCDSENDFQGCGGHWELYYDPIDGQFCNSPGVVSSCYSSSPAMNIGYFDGYDCSGQTGANTEEYCSFQWNCGEDGSGCMGCNVGDCTPYGTACHSMGGASDDCRKGIGYLNCIAGNFDCFSSPELLVCDWCDSWTPFWSNDDVSITFNATGVQSDHTICDSDTSLCNTSFLTTNGAGLAPFSFLLSTLDLTAVTGCKDSNHDNYCNGDILCPCLTMSEYEELYGCMDNTMGVNPDIYGNCRDGSSASDGGCTATNGWSVCNFHPYAEESDGSCIYNDGVQYCEDSDGDGFGNPFASATFCTPDMASNLNPPYVPNCQDASPDVPCATNSHFPICGGCCNPCPNNDSAAHGDLCDNYVESWDNWSPCDEPDPVLDCNGVCMGSSLRDECGNCILGGAGNNTDCNGDLGGDDFSCCVDDDGEVVYDERCPWNWSYTQSCSVVEQGVQKCCGCGKPAPLMFYYDGGDMDGRGCVVSGEGYVDPFSACCDKLYGDDGSVTDHRCGKCEEPTLLTDGSYDCWTDYEGGEECQGYLQWTVISNDCPSSSCACVSPDNTTENCVCDSNTYDDCGQCMPVGCYGTDDCAEWNATQDCTGNCPGDDNYVGGLPGGGMDNCGVCYTKSCLNNSWSDDNLTPNADYDGPSECPSGICEYDCNTWNTSCCSYAGEAMAISNTDAIEFLNGQSYVCNCNPGRCGTTRVHNYNTSEPILQTNHQKIDYNFCWDSPDIIIESRDECIQWDSYHCDCMDDTGLEDETCNFPCLMYNQAPTSNSSGGPQTQYDTDCDWTVDHCGVCSGEVPGARPHMGQCGRCPRAGIDNSCPGGCEGLTWNDSEFGVCPKCYTRFNLEGWENTGNYSAFGGYIGSYIPGSATQDGTVFPCVPDGSGVCKTNDGLGLCGIDAANADSTVSLFGYYYNGAWEGGATDDQGYSLSSSNTFGLETAESCTDSYCHVHPDGPGNWHDYQLDQYVYGCKSPWYEYNPGAYGGDVESWGGEYWNCGCMFPSFFNDCMDGEPYSQGNGSDCGCDYFSPSWGDACDALATDTSGYHWLHCEHGTPAWMYFDDSASGAEGRCSSGVFLDPDEWDWWEAWWHDDNTCFGDIGLSWGSTWDMDGCALSSGPTYVVSHMSNNLEVSAFVSFISGMSYYPWYGGLSPTMGCGNSESVSVGGGWGDLPWSASHGGLCNPELFCNMCCCHHGEPPFFGEENYQFGFNNGELYHMACGACHQNTAHNDDECTDDTKNFWCTDPMDCSMCPSGYGRPEVELYQINSGYMGAPNDGGYHQGDADCGWCNGNNTECGILYWNGP